MYKDQLTYVLRQHAAEGLLGSIIFATITAFEHEFNGRQGNIPVEVGVPRTTNKIEPYLDLAAAEIAATCAIDQRTVRGYLDAVRERYVKEGQLARQFLSDNPGLSKTEVKIAALEHSMKNFGNTEVEKVKRGAKEAFAVCVPFQVLEQGIA